MPGAHDRSVSDVPLEHPRRGEWKLKNLFIYMQDPAEPATHSSLNLLESFIVCTVR